ncbi:MAG: hypothetical protein QOH04_2819 [Sphingomonadales bacterium]|nr:hypothetical protein [Sphingomonadales bacterium]
MSDVEDSIDHPAWPMRIWLLMALGGALGIAFHFLIRGDQPWSQTEDPLRNAAAALVAVSGIVFAFSLERLRWTWSAAFSIFGGVVVAGVTFWNGTPSKWGSDEIWHFAVCLLAVAIAVPLFQALRDEGRIRLPVRPVHGYVWSNLILGAAAIAFVLASFLLAFLLSELFKLIGLHFLADLLNKGWFPWMLGCGALGAALGILRDRDPVLGALQRVVRAVLSFLAPVLSLGLVLFVLALPFTGLEPLWQQTKNTTPIVLACIAGALVLANAAIGNGPDEEPAWRPLRWTAAALAAVILPLAIVAAVSTGKRIAQYGYTPDRLWAGVFVAAAVAAAAAYLLSLVRGRARWPDAVRRANVRLAFGICLLALFLALPIVSFGAISTRDQVARLESGRVAPAAFDWRALRSDFGPSGREALARLKQSGATPAIRSLAAAELDVPRLSSLPDQGSPRREPVNLAAIRILPRLVPLPPGLTETLAKGTPHCAELGLCLLLYEPGDGTAALVSASVCTGDTAQTAVRRAGESCRPQVTIYRAAGGAWKPVEPDLGWTLEAPKPTPAEVEARQARAAADLLAIRANRVEIRRVERRQVFVGGRPAGEPFE